MKLLTPFAVLLLAAACATKVDGQATDLPQAPAAPKNVIVLIADGSGFNMLQATRYWSGEPLVVDGPEWQKLAQATYALRSGGALRGDLGPLDQDPGMAYDAARLYDVEPIEGEFTIRLSGKDVPYVRGFAGYEMLRRTAPDSAATASAMMTGVRTYNGAINVDGRREPVEAVSEVAHRLGKRVGIVSTVPWTHATPAAAGGAHNASRSNYQEIAAEILSAGVVDFLAGAGNPDYDSNARPRSKPSYTYYGEADWLALKEGTRADAAGEPWTLVQDTEAILALAQGPVPDSIVVVPRAGTALQQKRTPVEDRNDDGRRNGADAFESAPGDDPRLEGLPTLPDLARAALNAVDDDPDGFFLMIEGGAVDWAMHDNQLGRAIEEYLEFNETIRTVCDYLDAGTNGHNWENTLVVVTADHDHLLYGPDSDRIPFQELEDRGKGNMPGYRWLSSGHSNNLVPLFARGAGSDRFMAIADEVDEFQIAERALGHGPYLHQSELGLLLKAFIRGEVAPQRAPERMVTSGDR